MGNWNYGKSLDGWLESLTNYDKDFIVNMLQKYYSEIKGSVIHTSYFGTMDSVLLYSFVREYKPKNILEIGGGTSTRILFQALEKNGINSKLTSYAIQRTIDLPSTPKCIDYTFVDGDFLTTFFDNKINLDHIDFVFIDGPHESYFADFYCYEILDKIKPGTLVHIHDVHDPDVLLEGYNKGWYVLDYAKYPTITDEIFSVYLYLKHKGGFKILCRSNNLLEKNLEKIKFIDNVEKCLYSNSLSKDHRRFFKRKTTRNKEETQASSFYMLKEK